MSDLSGLPPTWDLVEIEECLLPYENGKKIRQGWSPQCERFPAKTNEHWGVLKTSAIQDGAFVDIENKHLPEKLEPREHLEVLPGDILMTCAGPRARCGVTCLVKSTRPKLLISGKMYQLRCDNSLMGNDFLEGYLREWSTKKLIDKMKTGISDSGLNLTHGRFKALNVPLPPLNEQKRIVAKIEELFSELDAGVASLRQARAQLGVYRQSLLKQAFEGKLTEKWRQGNPDLIEPAEQLLERIRQERDARYQQQLTDWQTAVKEWEANGGEGKKPAKPRKLKELQPLTPVELGRFEALPDGWVWQRLAQNSVTISDGPFGSNLKTSDYVGSGVRVIRLENIGYNEFIDSKESFVTTEKYETIKRHTVYPHDIVFSSFINDAVRATMVPDSISFAINKADCFCVHTFDQSLNPEYLVQVFSARYFFKSLESLVHGVGRPRINTTQLGEAPVPICSLPEQKEIVRILEAQFEAIEQNEREIDAALERSEALRQSILKKAFSGQLVPQDPKDEPASVLLERIRTEREAAELERKPARSTSLGRAKKAAKKRAVKKEASV